MPLLLLTRPEAASRRFLARLEAAAGPLHALVSPAFDLRPVPVDPGRPDALILTSEEGARRAAALGLAGRPAWCVGPRTAEVARALGFAATEAGPDAAGLVARLLAERPAGRLLHVRGAEARGDVAARLAAAGLRAGEAIAYRQAPRDPSPEARAALDGGAPLVAPLFSPATAARLAAWGARAPLRVVALSPAVAAAAAPLAPEALRIAARPEAGAMAEATLALLDPGRRGGGALEGEGRPV